MFARLGGAAARYCADAQCGPARVLGYQMKPLAASLLAIGLYAAPASAQVAPCPSFTAGWAVSGPGPITSVAYDQQSQILSVIWNNVQPTQYYPVPISVMYAFTNSRDLLATFNTLVAPRYWAILLQDKTNCPVVQENGSYIWVNGPGSGPLHYDLLLEGGFGPLLTKKGTLWLNLAY